MLKVRIIPSLLLKNDGLVKTVKFKYEKYIGDPINAIKIFNDKEVDELVILDITATKRNSINYNLISRLNKEAFMPLAYGGGIQTLEDVEKILALGYEKVVINHHILNNPEFISQTAKICGSQSVVACIDIKKDFLGKYKVYNYLTQKNEKHDALEWAQKIEDLGAGELLIYNVDREGTFSGYDIHLIRQISSRVKIPVVALGGASKVEDFKAAVFEGGASAVSAGSLFVFHGPHKAVLITYPDKKTIKKLFITE